MQRRIHADNPTTLIDDGRPYVRSRILPRILLPSRQANSSMGTPLNPSPSGIYWYAQPIQYHVRKTGYYCVGS
jgi:hypothetical protein